MSSIPDISSLTSTAGSLSGLIMVSPQKTIGYQPQNYPTYVQDQGNTQPALLFHYEGEQTVSLQSDITDHYVENNSAIQDHISLKPETITTHGFIGELNDVVPPELSNIQVAANKLTGISSYAPGLSATALNAYNTAFQLYQTAQSAKNSAVAAWASLTNQNGESVVNGGTGLAAAQNQNKQQTYFQQFYGYWRNRTLFTVQTPWAIFQDCAIMSLRAIQDAETNMISDFEITFKVMRFAQTQSVEIQYIGSANGYGRWAQQGSTNQNLGPQPLQAVSKTVGSLATP